MRLFTILVVAASGSVKHNFGFEPKIVTPERSVQPTSNLESLGSRLFTTPERVTSHSNAIVTPDTRYVESNSFLTPSNRPSQPSAQAYQRPVPDRAPRGLFGPGNNRPLVSDSVYRSLPMSIDSFITQGNVDLSRNNGDSSVQAYPRPFPDMSGFRERAPRELFGPGNDRPLVSDDVYRSPERTLPMNTDSFITPGSVDLSRNNGDSSVQAYPRPLRDMSGFPAQSYHETSRVPRSLFGPGNDRPLVSSSVYGTVDGVVAGVPPMPQTNRYPPRRLFKLPGGPLRPRAIRGTVTPNNSDEEDDVDTISLNGIRLEYRSPDSVHKMQLSEGSSFVSFEEYKLRKLDHIP